MIVFRGTVKMLKEMKLDPRELSDPGEGVLGSWFANVFRLERRKTVIVTNDRTRYSVMLHRLRKPDFDNLGEVFVQQLVTNLRADGFPAETVAALALACHPVTWGRTNSRSILGTIRDHTLVAKHIAGVHGMTAARVVVERNLRMNRTPILVMDPCYARDAMEIALKDWRP